MAFAVAIFGLGSQSSTVILVVFGLTCVLICIVGLWSLLFRRGPLARHQTPPSTDGSANDSKRAGSSTLLHQIEPQKGEFRTRPKIARPQAGAAKPDPLLSDVRERRPSDGGWSTQTDPARRTPRGRLGQSTDRQLDTSDWDRHQHLMMRLRALASLPEDVPPGIHTLPSCLALVDSLRGESSALEERLDALGRSTVSPVADLRRLADDLRELEEERRSVLEDAEMFDAMVREVDPAGVLFRGQVKEYFERLGRHLGFELLAPSEGEAVDVAAHEVAEVDGPVRRTPLTVLRREAIGYTDGRGTLVRARVVAHHPRED